MSEDYRTLELPEVRDPADELAALHARLEELERKYETMRAATLEWGKDVENLQRWNDQHLKRIMALEAATGIRSGHESPLVELVADAIAAQVTWAGIVNDRPARAAILAIAAEVERRGDKGLDLDPGETADWLRREANPIGQEDYER
jgi:septal ring factor EnvC (AmiA/AmiB activator)